jgi:predicted small metal-binding protein
MEKFYSFECEEDGFLVESKNKKEVMEAAKAHMKKNHDEKMPDAELNKKIIEF